MKNTTILLVDDDKILLNWVAKDLELENFIVSKAASGEEALTLLKDNHFNLVITDLIMPGLGGIQVLKEAKKKDPFMSVVILTGHGDMSSAIEALRLGADDYLLKPWEPDEFIICIERCLERQEAFKKIKFYESILPVCMYCKNIRNDTGMEAGGGEWLLMEEYLNAKIGASVSHTFCPQCQDQAEKDMLED